MLILTHSHGDHVLGLLNADGQPNFPNATYVMSRAEYEFWQARIDSGQATHRPIMNMMQQQSLRIIDMNENILDAVTAFPLVGHTPGQIGLHIKSAGQSLYHFADLVHSPIQLPHPEWCAKFDDDITQSYQTRLIALTKAANHAHLCLFYHLDFPGLGNVQAGEIGFEWHPVSDAS